MAKKELKVRVKTKKVKTGNTKKPLQLEVSIETDEVILPKTNG